MEIKKVFVAGAGFMGTGIAEVVSQAGIDVVVYDKFDAALERSRGTIEKYFAKRVSKGRMTEDDAAKSMAHITYTNKIELCKDADVAIEAASENEQLKIEIAMEIERHVSQDTIIATNTSSISITKIANKLHKPERFIGLHFFSPVPNMELLEIVKGLRTSNKVIEDSKQFAAILNKYCVFSKDEAGFIVNRMLLPMINEAIMLLEKRVGSIKEIDAAMKKGANHPMGPLELADMIGLDIELAVMEVIYEETGDSKYRPAVLLRRMVEAGMLGRKSGTGFYIYNEDGTRNANLLVDIF